MTKCPAVSEYLQGWRLQSFPDKPVLVLRDPHSEAEFPNVQEESPLFQFVPTGS